MDRFDKDIEALKQKIYKAGYVDACVDIFNTVIDKKNLSLAKKSTIIIAYENCSGYCKYVGSSKKSEAKSKDFSWNCCCYG